MGITTPEVKTRKSICGYMRSPEGRWSGRRSARRGGQDSNRRRSTGSSNPSSNKMNKTLFVSTNQPSKEKNDQNEQTTTTKSGAGCDWCRYVSSQRTPKFKYPIIYSYFVYIY